MKLTFYMPLKPPDHLNPSGDLIIGRELHDALHTGGHDITLASSLRSRWIYWKPLTLARMLAERRRVITAMHREDPDLWLTYHSYYKAPDMLGPYCSRRARVPYVIFQGIYSTKRKRNLKTLPGFLLNRNALVQARMVFTNKRRDEQNLSRLLPAERLLYIAPGVRPEEFTFDRAARTALRDTWRVDDRVVILTAAMFRPGVKTDGLLQVIASCAALLQAGKRLLLVIAGDGRNRAVIEEQARQRLGTHFLLLGKIPRLELYRYYSAADIFAFPGIQESLGMVYLEAQSAGLPVAAFQDWGAREAVVDGRTGILSPAAAPDRFTGAIETLLDNAELRRKLGNEARNHIRTNHDSTVNYGRLVQSLAGIARNRALPGP